MSLAKQFVFSRNVTQFDCGETGLNFKQFLCHSIYPHVISGYQNVSIIDASKILDIHPKEYAWQEHYPSVCAKLTVQFADALIKEMEKKND